MVFALLLAALATPTPSPSPSPSALPLITTVRVATGSPQTLHALPVAASSLDRAAIAASSAATGDELLRALPGFDRTRSNSLFTNYGQLRISFAGAGNDRGIVLADGIPAQDAFGGQVDWTAYPASTIQRAELLLGAGSALYGSGAVGGVLALQTFAPPSSFVLPAGQLWIGAGNNAYSEQWLNASGSVSPRLSTAVTVQQQRLQYTALAPAYRSSNSTISQASASMSALRLRYAAGPRDTIELGGRGAWDAQLQGRPNYSFSRRLSQTDLRYTHSGAQSVVQASAYSRVTFVQNVADQFPAQPGVLRYVQNVPTNESGASLQWIAGGGPSTFELRADARHVGGLSQQYGAGAVFQNSGSGLQSLGGAAVQETWDAGRLEMVAGARYDSVRSYGLQLVGVSQGVKRLTVPPDRSDAAISPRVALRYDASANVAVRASEGSGLRAPFLNELVRGFFIGSVNYQPNPALVPERSHTASAGIDVLGARSHLSFDAFDTSVSDAIMFRTVDATHQLRSNVARTHTDAYMLSYTQTLGTCSRVAAWLTTQNARVQSGPAAIAGKQLQFVPQQSASVEYAGRVGQVGAGVTVSYLGQTYADDLNAQPLGTAVLLGARVRIPLADGAALDVRGDNLTSARYFSSIDRLGPPTLVSIGVSLPIGRSSAPSAASCLP